MDLYQAVRSFCNQNQLIQPHSTIIVGLSGGPDSVFLLHFLTWLRTQQPLTLIAAHLDHQWRADSYKDTLWCEQLCNKLQVPLVVQQASRLTSPGKYNGSLEEQGRLLRRQFFKTVLEQKEAHAIALAHHADDQQENFFIRLMRGTSLTGLTGIKPKRGAYIRPLLATKKNHILEFLQTQGIAYLTDPTNQTSNYLRNRVRSTVIPALHDVDNRFQKNFFTTLQRLQEVEDFLEQHTAAIVATLTTVHDNRSCLSLDLFFKQPRFLQYRILIFWFCQEKVPFTPSEPWLQEIIRFLSIAGPGHHAVHPTWDIERTARHALITNNNRGLKNHN